MAPLAWNVVRDPARVTLLAGPPEGPPSGGLPRFSAQRPVSQPAPTRIVKGYGRIRVEEWIARPNIPLPWKVVRGGQPRIRGQAKYSRFPAPPASPPQPHPWKIVAGGQPRRRGHVNPSSQLPPGAPPPSQPPIQTHPWLRVVGGQPRRRGKASTPPALPRIPPPVQTHGWMVARGGQPRRRGSLGIPQRLVPSSPIVRTWSWKPAAGGQPRRRGRTWVGGRFGGAASPPPPPPVHATPLTARIVYRRGERQAIRARLGAGHVTIVLPPPPVPIVGYHIYSNNGEFGDPINYANPVATINSFGITTWTSFGLFYPATWSFGVRAFNQYGEEENVDCVVTFTLNSQGVDITNTPGPPSGLRAIQKANASILAEWTYLGTGVAAQTPTGFHVYVGTSLPLNYTTPTATTLYSSGIFNSYSATLTGLTNGTTYYIGVRAYNAVSQETNTVTVSCVADSVGPTAVVGLTIVATALSG